MSFFCVYNKILLYWESNRRGEKKKFRLGAWRSAIFIYFFTELGFIGDVQRTPKRPLFFYYYYYYRIYNMFMALCQFYDDTEPDVCIVSVVINMYTVCFIK